MSSVQRNISMDDLVGGLFGRLSGATGFPRTDSEAAFQEFLKRIPSSSNLAASGLPENGLAGAGSSGGGGGAAPQVAHVAGPAGGTGAVPGGGGLHGGASVGLDPTSGLAGFAPPAGVTAGGGHGGSGMPRVPSLDFLRHLSASAQQIAGGAPGMGAKPDANGVMHAGAGAS
eukprot:365668-Chlamydomonas_euryale.AAC.14